MSLASPQELLHGMPQRTGTAFAARIAKARKAPATTSMHTPSSTPVSFLRPLVILAASPVPLRGPVSLRGPPRTPQRTETAFASRIAKARKVPATMSMHLPSSAPVSFLRPLVILAASPVPLRGPVSLRGGLRGCLKNRKSTQSTGNNVDAHAQLHACLPLASSCDSCGFSCPSSRPRISAWGTARMPQRTGTAFAAKIAKARKVPATMSMHLPSSAPVSFLRPLVILAASPVPLRGPVSLRGGLRGCPKGQRLLLPQESQKHAKHRQRFRCTCPAPRLSPSCVLL